MKLKLFKSYRRLLVVKMPEKAPIATYLIEANDKGSPLPEVSFRESPLRVANDQALVLRHKIFTILRQHGYKSVKNKLKILMIIHK